MPNLPTVFPRWSVPAIVWSMLAVLALIVGGAALSLAELTRVEETARENGRETVRLIQATTAVRAGVLRSESAQRGLLLTGDEQYSQGYLDGLRIAREGLASLRGMMAADPTRESPDRLSGLVDRKFEELDRTVAYMHGGQEEAALALFASRQGDEIMAAIASETDGLLARQERRLAAYYADVDRSQRRSSHILTGLAAGGLLAVLLAAVLARRAARAEARARYINEIRAERDRADLIRRELSHRVKNLFAVIMSIISTTGRTETDPAEAARKTRERVQALARAHALSTGQGELREAHLAELVETVAGSYAPSPRRFPVSGLDLVLPARMVTPLGLILNELATNALKYGAWATAEGTVSVSWAFAEDGSLGFLWSERAGNIAGQDPVRKGFGTTMIDLSAEQAGARIERTWTAGGLDVTLRFDGVKRAEFGA